MDKHNNYILCVSKAEAREIYKPTDQWISTNFNIRNIKKTTPRHVRIMLFKITDKVKNLKSSQKTKKDTEVETQS